MIICLWDGSRIECEFIEISLNHKVIIVDKMRGIPIEDISVIMPKRKKGKK